MYPPHLNYATTLPRKTLTIKIAIFRGRFFVCKGKSQRRYFYWWKQFFPVKHPNDRVWSAGTKKRWRQKSPGSRKGQICQPRHALCWCVLWRIRKTAFHSREGKRKWQTLRESLLPKLVEDCKYLLSCGFIFQQDRAPTHTAKLAQTWIAANCSDFVGKKTNGHRTQQTSTFLTIMSEELQRYKTFHSKPNTIDELKKVLQSTWDDLPHNSINKAILNIVKKLRACVKAGAGHFEHEINCFHRVLNW